MKKILLLTWVLVSALTLFSQGWRKAEKEVKVVIGSPEQARALQQFHFNGDIYRDHARLYLVPEELTRLQQAGFSAEITIPDLNVHFTDFWSKDEAYHTYNEIIALADSLALNCPSICTKMVYGQSIQGRQIAGLKISDNVLQDENEAEVMFDGGAHGDEIGGPENMIRFARMLCQQYNINPTITNLVNNREIYIYLMMNPDGRVNMTRYNAAGEDINRDYGYMWWEESIGVFSQPESRIYRDAILEIQPTIQITYHSGIEYAIFPWSYRATTSPDHAPFNYIAQTYSQTSGYANLPYGQIYTSLYSVNGSSSDYGYGTMGYLSWCVELSYDKQPSNPEYYYAINVEPMLKMMELAGYGIEGTVTDAQTGEPVAAIIKASNTFPVYSDPLVGDYHKFLMPGTYSLTVMANGYQTQTVNNVVVLSGSSTVTNIQLQPEPKQCAYKVIQCVIPGTNSGDEGNTPAALSMPDNVYYSLGTGGHIILDMQFPVIDGPGPDISVFEGDATAEGYQVHAANSLDGAWTWIGTGNGTAQFDLADGNIMEARYIRIIDDGTGSSTGPDAGFDLDAITVLEQTSGVYLALFDAHVEDPQGNNNNKLDPGETAGISVTIRNNGDIQADNVTGILSSSSPYISINQSTAGFGNLGNMQSGTGTFTVTPAANTPVGQSILFTLDVSANNGNYSNSFSFSFVVGQIPLVIIDLDGNTNSGGEIQDLAIQLGVPAEYTTTFPADLSIYSTAFVCLGIYSSNHVLSASEGQALAGMLNNGGSVYMEGGDTWYYDTQTAVHPMFHITSSGDGSSDLGTLLGQAGTFTEGMSFSYSGDNNWIDRLNAGANAQVILQNQSPSYGTAVAYDGGTYKTIGASHEFGGLQNSGLSTKLALLEKYLDFFGLLQPGVTANFTADNMNICQNQSVQFTDASTGTGITSWAWTFEGGNPPTSAEQNPDVTYEIAGTFDVTLTVTGSAGSSTLTKTNYIQVNPLPGAGYTPLGDYEVCQGETNVYNTSALPNATGYEWVLYPDNSGILVPSGTSATITWSNVWTGTATLMVRGTNNCGGGAWSYGVGIEVMNCTGVPIGHSGNEIQVSPNPGNGIFRILTNSQPVTSLRVVSQSGQLIEKSDKPSFTGNDGLLLDLSEQPDGVFFIELICGQEVFRQKLILYR